MSLNLKIRMMRRSVLLLFFLTAFLGCSTAQQKDEITTAELKTLLGKESIQLVDVRTPQEHEAGVIQSAELINYFDTDFVAQISKKINKDKPVYLYCRTGNRSGSAAELLRREGFKAINVAGGYNQWKKENE